MSSCSIKSLIKTTKFLPDITVNGHKLDKTLLAQEIQYHPADSFSQAVQLAAQALILRILLKEAAGFSARESQTSCEQSAEEEQAIAQFIKANCQQAVISEAECLTFYQHNPKRFTCAPLMLVRHILFAADKADLAWRSEQQNFANKVLQDLQKQADLGAAFANWVAISRCPSKNDGGLLGEISAGQTVPEFERQLFNLSEGLASNLLETRYGFHIVWVIKKQAGRLKPFASVKDDIASFLSARRERQMVADFLIKLVKNADINGIELRPLDQNLIV